MIDLHESWLAWMYPAILTGKLTLLLLMPFMQAPGQGAHKLSFALRRAVSAMVRFVLLFVIFHLVTFCSIYGTRYTDWLNYLNCFGTFCANICLGGDVHHDLCGVCGHGPQPNHEHPSKQWWHVVVGFFPAAFCWLCFFDSLFFSFSPHSLFLHSPFSPHSFFTILFFTNLCLLFWPHSVQVFGIFASILVVVNFLLCCCVTPVLITLVHTGQCCTKRCICCCCCGGGSTGGGDGPMQIKNNKDNKDNKDNKINKDNKDTSSTIAQIRQDKQTAKMQAAGQHSPALRPVEWLFHHHVSPWVIRWRWVVVVMGLGLMVGFGSQALLLVSAIAIATTTFATNTCTTNH